MLVNLVPDCPRCGSKKTGRYIMYRGNDPGAFSASHMRHGELVIASYTEHDANLFCTECGFEWSGVTETKWLAGKALRKLKEEKGISEEASDFLDDISTNLTVEKDEEKKKGSRKRFIGGKIDKFFRKSIHNSIISPIKDLMPDKKQYDFIEEKDREY